MAEEYTCIECENLYDDTDGDTDERMCDKCLEKIDAPTSRKRGVTYYQVDAFGREAGAVERKGENKWVK